MRLDSFLSADMQDINLQFVSGGLLLKYKPAGCADVPSIFLSATTFTFKSVAEVAVPLLVAAGAGFTVPASEQAARQLDLAAHPVCRSLISVYVTPGLDVTALCRHLAALTKGIQGPKMYNMVHLGGLVYAEGWLVKQLGMSWGRLVRPAAGWIGGYYCLRLLKDDRKGRIYKALSFRAGVPGWVLLKEGRAHIWEDETGKDMRTRIDWQYGISCRVAGTVNVARPLRVFSQGGNRYMVTAFIEGKSLHEQVLAAYRGLSWRDFAEMDRNRLLTFFLKACRQVALLHGAGVVHRDLTTANFLMDPAGRVFLLDLELSFSMTERFPMPPFGMGTPGYMSEGQLSGSIPLESEDVFALGACLKVILTGLPPNCVPDGEDLAQRLTWISGERFLSELAAACCDRNPVVRPSVGRLVDSLEQRGHVGGVLLEHNVAIDIGRLKQRLESWVADDRFGLGRQVAAGNGPDPKAAVDLLVSGGQGATLIILSKLYLAGGSLKASNLLLERTVGLAAACLQGRDMAGHSSPDVVRAAVALVCALEAGLIEDNAQIRALLDGFFRGLPQRPSVAAQIGIGQALLYCAPYLDAGWLASRLAGMDIAGATSARPPDGKKITIHQLAGLVYFQGCLRRQVPDLVEVRHFEKTVRGYMARLQKHAGKGLVAPCFLRPLLVAGVSVADQMLVARLGALPAHPSLVKWSLEDGMAGYGRLLLEAQLAGLPGDWHPRTAWMAGLLCRQSVPVVEAGDDHAGEQSSVRGGRFFSEEAAGMYFLALYLLTECGGGVDTLIS